MRTVIDLTRQMDPRTVLDVGCGEGLVIRQMGVLWDEAEIHGVDIDTELLQAARRVGAGAEYVAASIAQLPLSDDGYDLVICTEVLEHLPFPQTALAEIVRVSKCHCLLSVPQEPWWRIANVIRGKYLASWGNSPGHVNHWSKRGFARLVAEFIDVVTVRQPFPWTVLMGEVPSKPCSR
jgi:2-polyprenyl-3-methyl-5-hydroxy-6-metoxy-1,4-benzoquinol methylase